MLHLGPDLHILECLGSGGVADVYRAKQLGSAGFKKIVAVKRILPHFAEKPEFIRMFQDEMNICANLQHPNIVQVYGNRQQDGSLYLLMEFVDGKNLAELLSRARRGIFQIPIEIACYIVSQIAKGLDYAHNLRDEATGMPAGIIHRDISPQNIMISYSGEVKIVDFGIAKASNSADLTRLGDMKGKIPYTSPENIDGIKLDQRSDIFSLGTVFFELLTNELLFDGSHAFEMIERVSQCKVPPLRGFRMNVPNEIEAIMLAALERDRNKRTQSAKELHRSLSHFMHRHFTGFTSSDLGAFMKKIFNEDIQAAQEARRAANLGSEALESVMESGVRSALTFSGSFAEPQPTVKVASPLPTVMGPKSPASSKAVGMRFGQRLRAILLAILVGINIALFWSFSREGASTSGSSPSVALGAAFPALAAWFKSSEISVGGDRLVERWSGSGAAPLTLTQRHSSRRPILKSTRLNGAPAVAFDGLDDYMFVESGGLASTGSLTAIIVARYTGTRTGYLIALQDYDRDTDLVKFAFMPNGTVRLGFARGVRAESKQLATASFAIYSLVIDGSSASVYHNGSTMLSQGLPTPLRAAPYISVGQEFDQGLPSGFLAGEVAELMLFERALSGEERKNVEQHLASKFNIALTSSN
ncbi:MAG: serine/threonine protein kinase [Deltaproteobacteria bacterium]|nr:serine/threonine protein kinase [Deltaproteobacteria bacterium]